ncbi:MAG TPA: ATP-binding protein, partial [Burkholderiaceae bacterium]|nr:ATP-binding protein [Burkholderiaceae bacterium]
AQTIVAQVASMKRMVDEFREYARMPSAQMAPLDLNQLIEEVVSLYGASPPKLELATNLPPIEGDVSQLRQVVHNLLQNAQDAMMLAEQHGTPFASDAIVVRTKAIEYGPTDDTRRNAVRLEVQDRGVGFSPKILARAFEPYVTTKPRGTGLGLAIVRKIAEEPGARVDIGNVDAGGAIVGITFYRIADSFEPRVIQPGAGLVHGEHSGRG